MTLAEIVEQLRSCNYECEAGRLEDNVAFEELVQYAIAIEVVKTKFLKACGIEVHEVRRARN